MKRIKSYGFWIALSGAVVMLVNALGEIFGFAVEDQLISNFIMAIAGVLIVLGVVNMPSKESDKLENEEDIVNDDFSNQKDNQDEISMKDEESENKKQENKNSSNKQDDKNV